MDKGLRGFPLKHGARPPALCCVRSFNKGSPRNIQHVKPQTGNQGPCHATEPRRSLGVDLHSATGWIFRAASSLPALVLLRVWVSCFVFGVLAKTKRKPRGNYLCGSPILRRLTKNTSCSPRERGKIGCPPRGETSYFRIPVWRQTQACAQDKRLQLKRVPHFLEARKHVF